MYQGILVLWDLLTMVGLPGGLVVGGSLLFREKLSSQALLLIEKRRPVEEAEGS